MEKEKDEEIKNQKHIEEVQTEQATNLLKYCLLVFLLSGISYLIGIFMYQSFDFGLIFELISFVFTLLAMYKINLKHYNNAKTFLIIAMIPLGWLFIYDLINLLINIKEVFAQVIIYYMSFDFLFFYLQPYLYDVLTVLIIRWLYKAYNAIDKVDKVKYNSVESFYDKL